MALNIGYLTSDKENNELYSPFYIVDPIIKYLPKDKIIWCPFDEEWSAFYVRLKECGLLNTSGERGSVVLQNSLGTKEMEELGRLLLEAKQLSPILNKSS